MKKSSVRVTLPDFDGNELLNLIEELVKLEERWIPPRSEYSLYIRPFAFSIDDALGVKKPDKAKLMIVTSPVGPYYATGFKPVSLFCATDAIRSAPKGTGAYKLGGYYSSYLEITHQLLQPQLKLRNTVINKFYGYLKDRYVKLVLATFSLFSKTKEDKLKL